MKNLKASDVHYESIKFQATVKSHIFFSVGSGAKGRKYTTTT